MMQRREYPSDLSEREWVILEPLIPRAKPRGHPRTTDMREVINAILYLDRTGGQWRALPHDFPPWSTNIAWQAKKSKHLRESILFTVSLKDVAGKA